MESIDLLNRTILSDGTVICQQSAMIEMLYSADNINGIFCDSLDDQTEWQAAARICDSQQQGPIYTSGAAYSNIQWQDYWFTPASYASIDVVEFCRSRCCSPEQHHRINEELAEIARRNMIPLIQHLIYCVDVWRANNIVWGVGRGSSVSSLVLHLIGINRINPLEYGLDFREWLK